MNNLFTTDFIKTAPISVAILDKNLCFKSYSKIWLKEFNIKEKNIVGKYYFDVIPNTPERLKRVYKNGLKGKSSNVTGQKFIDLNGNILWLKWKVDPWNDYEGNNAGIIIFAEDITATTRKKELLIKAQNVSKIGGWELDLATNQLHWTAVTKKIHEVDNDFIPKIDEGINFYKEGEHREKITKLVTKCIKEGESYDAELLIVTGKGNELWIRARGEAEFHKGRCVRILGTFQDIDSEKKNELKYKETAERLKIASSAAHIGIWEYNFADDSHVWNDQVYALHGIEKEDFSGGYEAWRALIHPEDQEKTKIEEEMALNEGKELNHNYRVIWPNGTIRHIQATAFLLKDKKGSPLKMIGTNWDITPIKEAQLKYKEVGDRLNLATNAAQIGIWEYDIVNDISVWDDNVYKLYGIDKDGFDGSDAAWRSMIHPEDRERVRIEEKMVLNGEKDLNHSYRVIWPNGTIRHIQSAAVLLKDEKGNPLKMIGTNWDITPIKKAEEKLRKLLEVTIEQNNNLLNFAHIVSHNLRSHSANLSMLSSFLINEENEEERKNLIHMINEASNGLNETVQHLNEVVNVKTNVNGNMVPINLYTALKNAEINIRTLLKEKEVIYKIDVPKSHHLKAVPAYLDSILLNLFTNSIKYSAPNRQSQIMVSSKKEGNQVVIAFSDNGQGIDLDRHGRKIFGMYKTFHGNKDAKGIGLFITKNQIEAMNGKIEVESVVDVGTTFNLYFEAN
ncbi:MAG: PAS domain-containing protein [Maribacter sp.]